MFLSALLIDVGENPDRLRPGRLWLRNRYRVHQRLCMAFPSRQQVDFDSQFLSPFNPQNFADGHVHIRRKQGTGFLYRIDPQPGNRVVILVLSALEPDWEYAFCNAGYLIHTFSKPALLKMNYQKNDSLRFRIEVNPVKRLSKNSVYPGGSKIDEKWIGKRVPVPPDQFPLWFDRHAEKSGFLVEKLEKIHASYAFFNKTGQKGKGQKLRSVRFDGILCVTDSEKFHETLFSGIGPAKAFGFGLLSVARIKI